MSEAIQTELFPAQLVDRKSKKEIQSLASELVKSQMDGGYVHPIAELVTAIRMQSYLEQRVKDLRPHAAKEMMEDRDIIVLGAKITKANEASRWEFDDNYITELEEELKVVKEKAKLKDPKNRLHITLSGEEVQIKAGFQKGGGDSTIKVTL